MPSSVRVLLFAKVQMGIYYILFRLLGPFMHNQQALESRSLYPKALGLKGLKDVAVHNEDSFSFTFQIKSRIQMRDFPFRSRTKRVYVQVYGQDYE